MLLVQHTDPLHCGMGCSHRTRPCVDVLPKLLGVGGPPSSQPGALWTDS